jgi:hypothetical protein
MRLVHKNRTGQPWHKAGHDEVIESAELQGCILGQVLRRLTVHSGFFSVERGSSVTVAPAPSVKVASNVAGASL